MDGYKVSVIHKSSGAQNQNAMDVASVVAEQVKKAVKIHAERAVEQPVHVKIDAIGVGWGVVSILQKWKEEQNWNAKIIGVNVAERANDQDKFKNQRAEMWWNGRQMLQPDAENRQDVRLDIDRPTMAQLSSPTFKSDSAGRIQIEAKAEMKRRGVTSPDRAEAVLLAMYEPAKGREPLPVVPVSLGQSNDWKMV
jgi:hypothetical protein